MNIMGGEGVERVEGKRDSITVNGFVDISMVVSKWAGVNKVTHGPVPGVSFLEEKDSREIRSKAKSLVKPFPHRDIVNGTFRRSDQNVFPWTGV